MKMRGIIQQIRVGKWGSNMGESPILSLYHMWQRNISWITELRCLGKKTYKMFKMNIFFCLNSVEALKIFDIKVYIKHQ